MNWFGGTLKLWHQGNMTWTPNHTVELVFYKLEVFLKEYPHKLEMAQYIPHPLVFDRKAIDEYRAL